MLASMPNAGPEPHRATAEFLPYQYAITPWPPSSVPLLTASSRSKGFTTEPAGSTSILSSLPDIALTLSAKSTAYSWKMSFDGQVLWKRRLTGAAALTIAGKPSAVAPVAVAAAAPRNLRRPSFVSVLLGLLLSFLLIAVSWFLSGGKSTLTLALIETSQIMKC